MCNLKKKTINLILVYIILLNNYLTKLIIHVL